MANLYVVATPIGNLEDLSFRALRILKEVDFILCEDTRVTKKLLDHYQIKTPTISYHQHSDNLKVDRIISLLRAGKNLALVSDAGTPGLSDPGGKLVSILRQEFKGELEIFSLPGASALLGAVAVSGVGFDRFLFLGFPPHKKGRQTFLKEILNSSYPVVVYESKHRIVKFLQELLILDSKEELEISLVREITKLHETFYQGRIEEILKKILSDPNNLKGEFVVLIRQNK